MIPLLFLVCIGGVYGLGQAAGLSVTASAVVAWGVTVVAGTLVVHPFRERRRKDRDFYATYLRKLVDA